MDGVERLGAEPRIRQGWIISFADLLCLILTFFVLLSTMQKVDRARWHGLADSLSRSLDPQHGAAEARPHADRNAGVLATRHAADLGYVETLFANTLRDIPALAGAIVHLDGDRLVIALPAELLFAPGSADLTDKARLALSALAGRLANIGNAVAVEGHTDPNPVDAGQYVSHRAMSIERALAVAGALRALGYPREIKAAGYGASRFSELVGVEPRELRYSLARRVDVVVRPYRGSP